MEEGATLHPGSCKFNLQYDGRPDERFGVWTETWSLGSLEEVREGGNRGEVCEELRKRMIEMCVV